MSVIYLDPHGPRRPARRSDASPLKAVAVACGFALSIIVGIASVTGGGSPLARLIGQGPRPAADDPRAYAFMRETAGGVPVTWDPCLHIRLVVNSRFAPQGADVLLAEAVERVNAASGLTLEVVGPTSEEPDPQQTQRELALGRPGGSRAPVLVAWTTPDVMPKLKGSTIGLGGPIYRYGDSMDRAKYIGGVVTFDSPAMAQVLRGPDGHAMARAIVMHELGHLVGLNHVDNTSQVMAPSAHHGVYEFAAGDRAGLARLGSGGCPYDTGEASG
ncbi:matrixin family metalloprotease [Pedococcus soli]